MVWMSNEKSMSQQLSVGFYGGIGTALFKEIEKWARLHDVWRLELTVMAHNTRAKALYKKVGFEQEGLKKASLIINGKCVDEYCMAKLLK